MTLSDGVAFLAAIVALTALIWNIVRDLNDRGNLLLSVMIGKLKKSTDGKFYIFSGEGYENLPGQYIMSIYMTNIGKRPILIEKWYITSGSKDEEKRKNIVIPFNLPQKLNESDMHSELTSDLSSIPYPIKKIVVVDSTGKEWCVDKNRINELNVKYKHLFKIESPKKS
jgi:hypothetical protein